MVMQSNWDAPFKFQKSKYLYMTKPDDLPFFSSVLKLVKIALNWEGD